MEYDVLINKLSAAEASSCMFTPEEIHSIKDIISERVAYKISYTTAHNIALSMAHLLRNYSGSIIDIMELQSLLVQLREIDPDVYDEKVKDTDIASTFEELMIKFNSEDPIPSDEVNLLLRLNLNNSIQYCICTCINGEFIDVAAGNKVISPHIVEGWFVIPK
jgi:hypothetical protein